MAHTLLYGGTFDPIHHGHLITCQKARELLSADKVLLIPAAVSPHKAGHHVRPATAAEHRVAMLCLAIDGIPHFEIDTRELSRSGGGPSYTADTLDELESNLCKNPGDRITLLIGADQLPKFHTWIRVRDILSTAPPRNHRDIAILGRPFELPRNSLDVGLEALRVNLGEAVAQRLQKSVLPTPLIEISATDIRDRARHHLPIHFLVPPAVAAYIQSHHLYQSATASSEF